MNTKKLFVAVLGAGCLIAASAIQGLAGDSAEVGRPILNKLLKAVQENDYEHFVEDGTAPFKAALTKQMLEGVSGQLAPRMQKGYSCAYLGELKQEGCQVLLWKLSYKDGGDDILGRGPPRVGRRPLNGAAAVHLGRQKPRIFGRSILQR